MNNKKTLHLLSILITIALLQVACGVTAVQPTSNPVPPTSAPASPTDTPIPLLPTSTDIPIPTATDTPRASSEAIVNVESLSIRSGPGPAYSLEAYAVRGDKLTILGQAYNCGWLNVSTDDGKTGWVAAPYLTYSLKCEEIAEADIPPLPTKAPKAQSTQGQSGSGSGSCAKNDNIFITNESNTGLYITLSGPATYSVLLTSGAKTTIAVCAGSYTWMANGCGGSGTGSGTVHSGGSLDLVCN